MADFIGVHYPNGSVEGVQVFIWDGSKPILWDGAISVSTSGGPIQDGANATIKATVLALTDSKPLTVAIVDANGDQIASFGGGTQYTDAAATVAHPIGTMPVYDNAGTISKVGMSNGLPVQIRATNVTQPVSGTVTVNDGKTHKSKTGSASATFTVIAAVTSKKIKVYSLSLMTVSATVVTVTFKDGASGTVIATYLLQAPASVLAGIAESVTIPSSLFETSAGTLLEMSFSAAVSVTYNIRYWDDDAT